MASLPSGVETSAPLPSSETGLRLPPGHFRLIQAILHDQTDVHGELVHENEWLLQPAESDLRLRGNLFALENVLDGTGQIFVKIAPEPHARSRQSDWDLRIEGGSTLSLQREDGYEWIILPYEGGHWGRIAALHAWQRVRRPYDPARDGLLVSNTWGDRSRDACLSPAFMAREIEAAARLGVDVVQIDDGWQKGVSANSAAANGGGAWGDFREADPHFWDVNPQRFPEGLAPLIASARERGIRFGLWFGPDSSRNAAHWRLDADTVLRLHRELGIEFVKIDGVKIESAEGERNLRAFFDAVRTESQGRVTLDLDVTAGKRFGYFGLPEPGPIFVQNRYTDWHRYWPHQTLRAAWKLAHWADPVRLRLEWLNHARNTAQYEGDPLAPTCWRPDTLFATVMFFSPLGWFEIQNLPPAYFEEAAPLIRHWKEHRAAIHGGTILPIGNTPDGANWTGFVSLNAARTGGHALLLRELNPSPAWETAVPLLGDRSLACEVLGGEGTARLENGVLKAEIPGTLRYLWVKF